jgi:putative transposase
MPYKQASTLCIVRLVPLRGLSSAKRAQCRVLRAEAGRLWTDLVRLHPRMRAQGRWMSASDLEQATKGGQYALHCQTIQALRQKFAAKLATASELRRQELSGIGRIQTEYPHHPKPFPTVVWKDQALLFDRPGQFGLKNGQGRPALYLPLPDQYAGVNLRRAELTWRADHYELCLTIDMGETALPLCEDSEVAGVDLGEVHVAAVTTTKRHALLVSGRMLRACKQGRNKRHVALRKQLSRCQPDSRRARRSRKRKAQVSAKHYRQQRDILHQAARRVVDFCNAEGVSRFAVGDVRDIQTGVHLGPKTNQTISQWPHGQFAHYLREKAARLGMRVEWIDEAYSTETRSQCRHQRLSSPRGRRFHCSGCGARMRRDVSGSNNICAKAAYGAFGRIQADTVKYLRPIGVVPRHRPEVARAT